MCSLGTLRVKKKKKNQARGKRSQNPENPGNGARPGWQSSAWPLCQMSYWEFYQLEDRDSATWGGEPTSQARVCLQA